MLRHLAKRVKGRGFPTFGFSIKSDVSNEMLMSASMGWSAEVPKSQTELTDLLKKNNIIHSSIVYEVFKSVDRINFWSPTKKPYWLDPLLLSNGQKLTSPITQAIVLESILPSLKHIVQSRDDIRILDIGFGFGWTTAMLSLMADRLTEQLNPNCKVSVIGLEIYDDFIYEAKDRLSLVPNLNVNNIDLLHLDICTELSSLNKFDVIHAACAFAPANLPKFSEVLRKQETSRWYLPVIRSDGEQDFWVFKFDSKMRELIKESEIMRSFFTEAKSKIDQDEKNVEDYFYNDPNEALEEEEIDTKSEIDEDGLRYQLNKEKLDKLNLEINQIQDKFIQKLKEEKCKPL
jgi:protein-L-isoaspartate O-methyltransferase